MFESLGHNGKKPVRPPRGVSAEMHDPRLAAQIQAEVSVAGSLIAQQINLQIARACLHEQICFSATPNGLNGLAADLSNLFSSFQLLANDPANLPLRRRVVRSAQEVVAQFNRASTRLAGVRKDLNSSIQKDADRANQILQDIAGVNQQIMEVQAAGGTTGRLTDQRERRLEAISGCANITVTPRPDGGVKVSIGGVIMVTGAEMPDSLTTYRDKNGDARLQAKNAGRRLTVTGGCIAGKITARDGGLASLQGGLHNLAAQLITRMNAVYSSGCDLKDGAGHDFFTGSNASDIGVNRTVATDPSQLPAGSTAEAMAQLGGRNVSDLGNQTFGQWYVQTVSALGNTLSNVNDNLISSQAVRQMLANERGAASGLSPEEAATDLMWYQQARAASVRIIKILDKMPPME